MWDCGRDYGQVPVQQHDRQYIHEKGSRRVASVLFGICRKANDLLESINPYICQQLLCIFPAF